MEVIRIGEVAQTEVPHHETMSLIASDKVEGTTVYGADCQKIGRIENMMIDKLSGKVAYAVLSFGGFLGLGTDRYPLPWSVLRYDENLSGYLIHLSSEQLKGAPRFAEKDVCEWDLATRTEVDRFYGAATPTM
jgi:hypothetical protein